MATAGMPHGMLGKWQGSGEGIHFRSRAATALTRAPIVLHCDSARRCLLCELALAVLDDLVDKSLCCKVNIQVLLRRSLKPSRESFLFAVRVHLVTVLDQPLLGQVALYRDRQ